MPKLDKKLAKKVDKAEATHGFALITPGKYFGVLRDVTVESDRNGTVVWACEFNDLVSVDTGENASGRQWLRLSHPNDDVPEGKDPKKWATAQELNLGRIKAFYEAFGYEVESDTDEMIGETAVITIGIRTISDGARRGEKVNSVNDIESVEEYGDAPEKDSDDSDTY